MPLALSNKDLSLHIDRILAAALATVDPETAASERLYLEGTDLHIGREHFDLSPRRLFMVDAGKTVKAMGRPAARRLGKHLHRDWLNAKDRH